MEGGPVSACRTARIVSAYCDRCRRLCGPGRLHIPEEEYGFWCGRHCPACNPDQPKPNFNKEKAWLLIRNQKALTSTTLNF